MVRQKGKEILFGHTLLAVSQGLEAVEGNLELLISQLAESELLETRAEGSTSRVLSEDQVDGVGANGLGADNLVGLLVFQNSVLVNSGFVQEGVGSYNGLVGLYYHAREGRYQLRDPEEERGVDGVVDGKKVGVGMDSHDNLLHGSVACTLANTIDRDLDLTDSIANSREGVGSGESEIVVAMSRPDDLVGSLGVSDQVLDHGAVLLGHVVTDSVGDVEGCGAGLDDGREDRAQKVLVTPSCILGRELDIGDEGPCEGYCCDGTLHALIAGDFELVLEVNVGSGEEGVDAFVGCVCDCIVAALDIGRYGTGKTGDCLIDWIGVK